MHVFLHAYACVHNEKCPNFDGLMVISRCAHMLTRVSGFTLPSAQPQAHLNGLWHQQRKRKGKNVHTHTHTHTHTHAHTHTHTHIHLSVSRHPQTCRCA